MSDDFFFDDDNEDETSSETLAVKPAGGLTLLPPRQMADCFGHKRQEAEILDLWQQNRLPHALIFSGQQGIGKSVVAFRLVRFLLEHGAKQISAEESVTGLFDVDPAPPKKPEALAIDSSSRVFSQVSSGGHPDFLYVERPFDEKKNKAKQSIDVEEIRRVAPFMRMKAGQGGWRIALVDDADTMARSAQNAVLKILEEPPEKAMIILVTHRLASLVPTIRSRSRVISFQPLDKDVFYKLVTAEHPALPRNESDLIHDITGGSAGDALRLMNEGGLEAIGKILSLLRTAPDWDWLKIHELAEALSRTGQEESLAVYRDIFCWITESLVRARARNEKPAGILNESGIIKLFDRYSLAEWAEISGRVRAHFDTVQAAALDRRLAVTGAFSLMKEAV